MREPTVYRATELATILETEGRKARWLADRVGISESHLSRVLKGERLIGESMAVRIAETIGRPLFLLFEFTSVNESVTTERSAA